MSKETVVDFFVIQRSISQSNSNSSVNRQVGVLTLIDIKIHFSALIHGFLSYDAWGVVTRGDDIGVKKR